MCGICGIHALSATLPSDGRALVGAMVRTLAHRGPDDESSWSDHDAGVHFGFRRLSIIDLSKRGRQPMAGRNGSRLMLNGEIYNYRALRASLGGYPFRSASDSEVLVAGLETKGEAFLQEANGMFGLAWWDATHRRLLLARDRIGIKPLYYSTLGGIFAFGSEPRALLELPWVSARLNHDALAEFLTFNKLAAPATLFEGIHKFHPGHLMVVSDRGIVRYEPFWEPRPAIGTERSRDDCQVAIRTALEDSVDLRMVSDVPVGAFLSGGVDSSAVAALMAARSSSPLRTYTIGFDEPAYDEREYARTIADAIGAEHHERVVSKEDLEAFLPTIAEIFDDPLADATSIPIYFLARLAGEGGTKVILTGDGADELFCGYRGWLSYRNAYPWFERLSSRWNPLRPLLPAAAAALPPSSRWGEILRRAASGDEFFWGGAGGLKGAALTRILRRPIAERERGARIRDARARFDSQAPWSHPPSAVDWMSFLGITDIVPSYYLHRADRLGMAASIELRVPFLDHRLVELGLRTPGHLKVEHGVPKSILKTAVTDLMPRQMIDRRKMGFCVPLNEWFGASILEQVDSRLDRFCDETGLFNAEEVRELCRQASAGSGQGIHGLWSFYFLMTWFERWLS